MSINQPNISAEVAIVGAGPVGLTLACGLAQLGVAVRILDKSPATKTQPRAAIVWQRAEEDWGRLGVMPRVLAEAGKLAGIDIYHAGKRLGGIELGCVPGAYPHPLILEQHIIERLLTERLSDLGVDVEWGAEMVDLALEPGRAVLQVQRGGERSEIEAGWVVGCEGSRSLVRERAGIAFPGRRRKNLQCLTVDAVPEWHYPEECRTRGRFFLAPNVALGCFPLPGYDGHAYRFYAFANDETGGGSADPPTLGEMQALIARVADAPELRLTLTEPRWLGRARFQDRIAETLWRGRALLAGDSAHVWAPIAGHGMNTGVIGAGNLAWKLAAVVKGHARESLLDTYSGEQRATARLILRQTKLDFVETPHSAQALKALAAILPPALRQPALQRWMDATLSSLGISYHGSSPLAERFGLSVRMSTTSGGPLVLRSGDGFPFHALGATHLEGYHRWLLLYVCAEDISDERLDLKMMGLRTVAWQYCAHIAPAVLPRAGDARSERMLLVRPDGHIGTIARPGDLSSLNQYLDRYLFREPTTPTGAMKGKLQSATTTVQHKPRKTRRSKTFSRLLAKFCGREHNMTA